MTRIEPVLAQTPAPIEKPALDELIALLNAHEENLRLTEGSLATIRESVRKSLAGE